MPPDFIDSKTSGYTRRTPPSQHDDVLEQPIFRIETPSFTLWIIAHHLVSANLARREALVQSVNTACQQVDEEKQHHLLIVSDHWFDRSKASKEIPAWWLGHLPTNTSDYLADGIRLQECTNTLQVPATEISLIRRTASDPPPA